MTKTLLFGFLGLLLGIALLWWLPPLNTGAVSFVLGFSTLLITVLGNLVMALLHREPKRSPPSAS